MLVIGSNMGWEWLGHIRKIMVKPVDLGLFYLFYLGFSYFQTNPNASKCIFHVFVCSLGGFCWPGPRRASRGSIPTLPSRLFQRCHRNSSLAQKTQKTGAFHTIWVRLNHPSWMIPNLGLWIGLWMIIHHFHGIFHKPTSYF